MTSMSFPRPGYSTLDSVKEAIPLSSQSFCALDTITASVVHSKKFSIDSMYHPNVCQKPLFGGSIVRDRDNALGFHLDLAPMNGSLDTLNIHDLSLSLGVENR